MTVRDRATFFRTRSASEGCLPDRFRSRLGSAPDGTICEDKAEATITKPDPPPPDQCETKIQAMLLKHTGPDIFGATHRGTRDLQDTRLQPLLFCIDKQSHRSRRHRNKAGHERS